MSVIQGICYVAALVLLIAAFLGFTTARPQGGWSNRVSLFAGGMMFWLIASVFVPWLGG